VLDVENWAEIRRLHRAEGLPIRAIARVMGVPGNTVRAAVASDGPPKYERPRPGSIVDGFEPAIRELLKAFPGDAGDGDRGAGRVGAVDPGAVGPGGGAAAGVPAAGPGEPDQLCAGGDRAVRFLVPRHHAAGGVRAGPGRRSSCRC
jgi:hypothetical protein